MSFFIFAVCLLYYPLIVFFCSQAGIRIRDSSVKGRRDNHFSTWPFNRKHFFCYKPTNIFLCICCMFPFIDYLEYMLFVTFIQHMLSHKDLNLKFQNQNLTCCQLHHRTIIGRADRARTCDILVPNQVHYQLCYCPI